MTGAKPTEVNTGQQKFFTDTNPNSPTYGKQTGGAPVQLQASPEAVMTDKRARETLQETKRHNGVSEIHSAATASAAGKAPAGYRWSADGRTMEAIPGGPADKGATATEGERKAATLLQRLEFSSQQLAAARKANPDASKPGLISNGLEMIGMDAASNSIQSDARQQIEGAQLDMLDAALTLGTGASYTTGQLKGYAKSYFPQIGDSEATIKDKDARLKNVIDAAHIAAGRAGKNVTADKPAPAGGMPSDIQALLLKHGGGK